MSLYNTEVSRGSLMPLESKRIAALLLTEPDAATWKRAIEADNILQKDTVGTAVRQSVLIRKRLATLDATAWTLITERESEVANQLLFAAAIKQNKLLGDFMRNVYASRQQQMEPDISVASWEDFLTECSHHDSSVASWNENTKLKIINGIARILIEAKYLVDRKSMKLSPRDLHPVVRRYLVERNEKFVLDCLERTT
jgi:Putative inner membrane protein (DUF1819)